MRTTFLPVLLVIFITASCSKQPAPPTVDAAKKVFLSRAEAGDAQLIDLRKVEQYSGYKDIKGEKIYSFMWEADLKEKDGTTHTKGAVYCFEFQHGSWNPTRCPLPSPGDPALKTQDSP